LLDENISSSEGCSSTLGAAGREDDSRDDIHRELREVSKLLCDGDDEDGMEEEEDERAKGGAASSSESPVLFGTLLMMVGDVDVGRGGERVEIGQAGDNDGVANGLSLGRGGSLGPVNDDDASPLPLDVSCESESRSSSDTSLLAAWLSVVASPWPGPPCAVTQ